MSVLVYTENWDGKFKKLSFELVSYGSKLAEMLGTTATVLSLGEVDKNELENLGKYGADKIINGRSTTLKVLDIQAYTQAIATVAEQEGASVIVLSNNNSGKAIVLHALHDSRSL